MHPGRWLLCFSLVLSAVPQEARAAGRAWTGTRLLGGFYYQGSFAYGAGGILPTPGVEGGGAPLTGVRVHERHGGISYLVSLVAGALVVGLSATEVHQTSETRTLYDGVYTKVTETTTTTTYTQTKSDAEIAESLSSMKEGLSGGTWLDLTVYANPLLGWDRHGAEGYDFSFGLDAVLGTLGDEPIVLDLGLQGANVRIAAPPSLHTESGTLYYASLAVLARLYVPLTRFAWATAEIDLNLHSLLALLDDDLDAHSGRVAPSPLKLGVELLLTDRFFARGQAIVGGFGLTEGRLGYLLEAGVRL